jgi:hypothetical protein
LGTYRRTILSRIKTTIKAAIDESAAACAQRLVIQQGLVIIRFQEDESNIIVAARINFSSSMKYTVDVE